MRWREPRIWLALADAVADAAPHTAELMTAAAYLAQSALEERLPDLIRQLSDVLTGSGFSSGAVEGVRSALLANRLAFTPEAVTDELVSLYADLGEDTRSWPVLASRQSRSRPGALARTLTPSGLCSPPGPRSPTGC